MELQNTHNSVLNISVMETLLLLLSLLWPLVEANSQTEYPYVSFMGETLPNHSYVNLNLVGYNGSVQCHTDLITCCNGSDHHGEWTLPSRNERKLQCINKGIVGHTH